MDKTTTAGQILNFKKYANDFTTSLHRNIAREIVHEAWERFNVTVEDDLSLWLVKLLAYSPAKCIRVNTSFEHTDIDNLIGKCLEIISGKVTAVWRGFGSFTITTTPPRSTNRNQHFFFNV